MIACQELIISDLDRRGKGTNLSPIRVLTQVYAKDGTLIAEHDPNGNYTIEDLVSLAEHIKKGQSLDSWISGQ